MFFLFLFGISAVLGALESWNVFGMDARTGVTLVVGVALLGSGIVVWKNWEE